VSFVTVGEFIALRVQGLRTKYGEFPVDVGAEPLDGFEDFPIVDSLPERMLKNLPLNRAERRKRMSRVERKNSWSRRGL